jgi:hypothetical protein
MNQKWMGLIFCIVLGIVVTIVLLDEGKRPIHVHITADEIVEGLCNAETESTETENNDYKETLQKRF